MSPREILDQDRKRFTLWPPTATADCNTFFQFIAARLSDHIIRCRAGLFPVQLRDHRRVSRAGVHCSMGS